MKPSHTPETTATLPMPARQLPWPWPARRARSAAPRTTSSSLITLAGLKKCRPSTSAGRCVKAAIRSTSSVEVFEARIAPGLHTCVELREDLLLDLHVLEHRLDHQVDVGERRVVERGCDSSAMRSSTCCVGELALVRAGSRSCAGSSPARGPAPPAASRAAPPGCPRSGSSSRCPPPIVPAPITPTLPMFAQRRVLRQPGTLPAARSAKKTGAARAIRASASADEGSRSTAGPRRRLSAAAHRLDDLRACAAAAQVLAAATL